jgi:hypothetical protein
MPTKTRIITVTILILLGGALFSYCVFFYPIDINTQVKGGSTAISASEGPSVKDTPTSTVGTNKSSQTKQSRSQRKSPPKAGPI